MPTIHSRRHNANGYARLAQGPQTVTFRIKEGLGDFRIDASAALMADDDPGLRVGVENVSLELEAGEALFIKAEGTLVAAGTTLEIASD